MNIKLILQCMMAALAFVTLSCGSKQNKSTEFSPETISVTVAQVKNVTNPSTVYATGLISTENEARYAFKIGGVIDRVLVKDGQHFNKGQVLATLKITEIDAQVSQVKLSYEKAKRDYTRALNLYNDSVATLEQLENAKTALDVAKESVDLVGFNKKYTTIYAESSGFVTKKMANEGEIIDAGMPVLAINESNGSNDWVLKLGLNDKSWTAVSVGNAATVVIDAFHDKEFNGKVLRKSLAADPITGSFEVLIKLDMKGDKPAIGMFGKAKIVTNSDIQLPVIPYNAVIEADGNNAFVFVPVGNNKVKRVPIVIESFDNEHVVVHSGLENVTEIVESNSAFLNDNSNITIIK